MIRLYESYNSVVPNSPKDIDPDGYMIVPGTQMIKESDTIRITYYQQKITGVWQILVDLIDPTDNTIIDTYTKSSANESRIKSIADKLDSMGDNITEDYLIDNGFYSVVNL